MQRFLNKIKMAGPDDCWEWQAGRNTSGYGWFRVNGRSVIAHRFMYRITYGSIPPHMLVCHRCDNPLCCNPAHLFLGSDADNNADKEQKQRGNHPFGIHHGRHKLTEQQVREIRELHQQGIGYWRLAQRFPVSKNTIQLIVHHRIWKHVP